MNKEELLTLCECGCGGRVSKVGNKFIWHHHIRGINNPMKNPVHRSSVSKSKRGILLSPEHCLAISRGHLKEKDQLLGGFEFDKNSKMVTNKDCPDYLGCYIAEQILSKIFKNVKVMPYGNPGYDFICGNGYKIDVKSSATGYKGHWQFQIAKSKIPDYYLLIAFNDRNNLIPEHLWLVPKDIICHLKGFEIAKSTIHKWNKYEQSLDKVILCCNKMRGE